MDYRSLNLSFNDGCRFYGLRFTLGQMSFWGATVITNLFSAIPLVGESITTWLWGAYSVDNPTLNRFFNFIILHHFNFRFSRFTYLGTSCTWK